jgi:hypothetical protein
LILAYKVSNDFFPTFLVDYRKCTVAWITLSPHMISMHTSIPVWL